jgi:hypothetical protein
MDSTTLFAAKMLLAALLFAFGGLTAGLCQAPPGPKPLGITERMVGGESFALVRADGLRVRTKPWLDGTVLHSLNAGEVVAVVETAGDDGFESGVWNRWYRIGPDVGDERWVNALYVDLFPVRARVLDPYPEGHEKPGASPAGNVFLAIGGVVITDRTESMHSDANGRRHYWYRIQADPGPRSNFDGLWIHGSKLEPMQSTQARKVAMLLNPLAVDLPKTPEAFLAEFGEPELVEQVGERDNRHQPGMKDHIHRYVARELAALYYQTAGGKTFLVGLSASSKKTRLRYGLKVGTSEEHILALLGEPDKRTTESMSYRLHGEVSETDLQFMVSSGQVVRIDWSFFVL